MKNLQNSLYEINIPILMTIEPELVYIIKK